MENTETVKSLLDFIFSSFNFQLPTAQSVSLDNEQEAEIPESNDQQISDSNNIDISSEFQITVTRTTFDTSSPSEDGTTQDISSDIDSIQSPEEHEQKLEYKTKMEVTKGS